MLPYLLNEHYLNILEHSHTFADRPSDGQCHGMYACSPCDVISSQGAFGGRGGSLNPGTGAMNLPSSMPDKHVTEINMKADSKTCMSGNDDNRVPYLFASKKWRGGGQQQQQYLMAACH